MKFGTPCSPLAAVQSLKRALRPYGLVLKIIENPLEIDEAVFRALRSSDYFISSGTKEYGKDSGNPASSAEEVQYWSGSYAKRGKMRPILVRMIPFSAEFKHSAADRLFNVDGNLQVLWLPKGNDPCPNEILRHILDLTETRGHLPGCKARCHKKCTRAHRKCTCGRSGLNGRLARAQSARAGGLAKAAKLRRQSQIG